MHTFSFLCPLFCWFFSIIRIVEAQWPPPQVTNIVNGNHVYVAASSANGPVVTYTGKFTNQSLCDLLRILELYFKTVRRIHDTTDPFVSN
jgi:hypothetical protein